MQPLTSELGECCPHSLHLEQPKESRHSDSRLAPNQQERTKSSCNSMGPQQGTYIGQFADCVCLHCDVVLLQLLLDLIDALRDVFCLRKTNKNLSPFTRFSRFSACWWGTSSRTRHLQAPNLTRTLFSKHLTLTKLLIKKNHHNSVTKAKV